MFSDVVKCDVNLYNTRGCVPTSVYNVSVKEVDHCPWLGVPIVR